MMIAGWREYVDLPEFDVFRIKAKLDTGARTSALHVHQLAIDLRHEVPLAHFLIKHERATRSLTLPVIDQRWIKDSGGHRQHRPVIQTLLRLGDQQWPIEITLTNRSGMRHGLLLGRSAMQGWLQVDPAQTFLLSPKSYSQVLG
jgi:hypothetical protein